MALLNYTSNVPHGKTAAEIADILRKGGAQAVLTEYDPEGQYITALSFKISLKGQPITFRLPCDWKPVYEVMFAEKKNPYVDEKKRLALDTTRKDQAMRTAWRIVKDWVEAQMALVQVKMVRTEQVFLPYAVMANGRTLGEHIESDPGFLLGNGK